MDIVGSNVGERMRMLFLRAVLYMEIAWFDQDANAGSILTAHLATSAPAVRGAAGDRAAALAQIGVSFSVGLAISLTISWNVTLVLMAALLLLSFVVYVKEVCTGMLHLAPCIDSYLHTTTHDTVHVVSSSKLYLSI